MKMESNYFIKRIVDRVPLIKHIYYKLYPDYFVKESIVQSIKYFVEQYSTSVKGKKILDFGCGNMPYSYLFTTASEYIGIDFKDHTEFTFGDRKPDLYFDKSYPKTFHVKNIQDNSFDTMVSFEVLEHHQKPEVFFKEAARILKKNGTLVLTVPFLWPLHEEPYDFQRLTEYQIRELSSNSGFKILEVIRRGTPFQTIIQMYNTFVLSLKTLLAIKLIILMVSLPMQVIVSIISRQFFTNNSFFLGYSIILIKK